MTQITRPTGIELRDQGMEAVIAADVSVHRGAGEYIKDTIAELARTGREFTAEDVRAELAGNPKVVDALAMKPNLLPALMGSASKSGQIISVGMRRPKRASRRASRNLVWIGWSL